MFRIHIELPTNSSSTKTLEKVQEIRNQVIDSNLIELDNGQYCLYPNNRTRIFDNSLSPKKPLKPDFKVSTIEYQVENGQNFRLGETDQYFYELDSDKS